MNYKEPREKSSEYKKQYVEGIESLINARQSELEKARREYIKEIFASPEKYRTDFKKMLGWPLCEERVGLPEAVPEKIATETDCEIYRMTFDIIDGFKMSGLFFKRLGEGKKPLVIVQHGGEGTPEMISGLYGDTANYNDMLDRVANKGVHVFAPQLLLWADGYNLPYNRVELDAKLKRVGSSVTALEVYGIQRILDYFEGQEYVKNLGMVGMSYGGFYTLFTAAADTRIKAAVSSSFFNSRDAVCWADWSWKESAYRFDDAEAACLIYPRKLWIAVGDRDELFDAEKGKASFEKLQGYQKEFGANRDWLWFKVFEGTHEFIRDDAPIEGLVAELLK